MRRLNNQHERGVVTLDSEFRLDVGQVAFFKAHGYLILENLIDGDTLTFWRDQIWQALGIRPGDRESWPDRHNLNDFQFDPRINSRRVIQRIRLSATNSAAETSAGDRMITAGAAPLS